MPDLYALLRVFRRIAGRGEEQTGISREACSRLLERLDFLRLVPRRILVLSGAAGLPTRILRRRFPDAEILAMDRAVSTLRAGARRSGWSRPRVQLLAGDPHATPLAADSVDLVVANLMFRSCEDPDAALASLRRILHPDGLLLISALGPDTLTALRTAFAKLSDVDPAGRFTDVQVLGDMLVRSGFTEPVLDTDWLTTTYAGIEELLREAERVLHWKRPIRPEWNDGLAQVCAGYRLPDGRFSATWEVVYASAWGPAHGQPIRSAHGEEASVPVTDIGRRRR